MSPVYINYCAVCLKIDYTLRCLEYARAVMPLIREDTDECTLN